MISNIAKEDKEMENMKGYLERYSDEGKAN